MSQQSQNKQACLAPTLSNTGPSQILPFLYVGCQEDAISTKTMQDIHITHVINVSTTGDRATFLNENDDEHFLRIPIDDCLNAQLLPYLDKAYTFIEKARLNHGRVFIHCLAGISRSPALAIAYVMRYLHLSFDDAYQYVKQRRSQISPNFNFVGQLAEYERNLSTTSNATLTTTPMVKCVETPLNDRRRFVQVECSSNNTDDSTKYRTNNLSRPKSLLLPLSTMANLSIDSSQQKSLPTPKSLCPNNISSKRSTLELINTSCEELKSNKRNETVSKSADTS